MSNKHTPEPWTIENETQVCNDFYELANVNEIADAARIVTCVNALAGIDDPERWVEMTKEKILELNMAQVQLSTVTKERDELLAEVRRLTESMRRINAPREINFNAIKNNMKQKMYIMVDPKKHAAFRTLKYQRKDCINAFMGGSQKTWKYYRDIIGWRCIRVLVELIEIK